MEPTGKAKWEVTLINVFFSESVCIGIWYEMITIYTIYIDLLLFMSIINESFHNIFHDSFIEM